MMRIYGPPPYRVALVHGGPGAAGEMAPVARALAVGRGVLEPLQTATSLAGQVEELVADLQAHADLPVTLVGHSWGAWLSTIVAARQPALVAKLVLVSSGPYEERYAADLERARLGKLSAEEQREYGALVRALADPHGVDEDARLARLGALAAKADAYDPIEAELAESSSVRVQGDIYRRVWEEAAALRRSGELLELARCIRCPVVAIHGEEDPHPGEGVRAPLAAAVARFRFIPLARCGHTPWVERQARAEFYRLLEKELRTHAR